MGEAKRRKLAGTPPRERPTVRIYPQLLQRPDPPLYRTPQGNVAIVVDEPDRPLVALHLLAEAVAPVIEVFDKVKSAREVEEVFLGAFHSWLDGERNPVPGIPADEAHAFGMSAVYWMAFSDRGGDNPARAALLRESCRMQLEHFGAACITMGILLRPHSGSAGISPRTRRWLTFPHEPPTYTNPNTVLGRNESMH